MKKIMAAVIALSPSFASAHSGHIDGFITAFAHPFTGIDHLLMMLGVGMFAGRIGGRMRWQLPLVFLMAMLAGWMAAATGFIFSAIESGIAAGLIVLGVLFMRKMAMPPLVQLSAVALFAALHGMAHGAELSHTAPIATGAAILFATASLHALGFGAAMLLSRSRINVYREMGAVLAMFGGALFVMG